MRLFNSKRAPKKDIRERFLEEMDRFDLDEDLTPDPSTVKTAPSSGSRTVRLIGFLLLALSVLGLLFVAPTFQDIPFIASLRSPLAEQLTAPGLLLTLSQLPPFLWFVLLALGTGLAFLTPSKKGTAQTGTGSKTPFFGSNNVENWPGGLHANLAQSALECYNRHVDNCPDAFSNAPGIRLLTTNEDLNSRVTGVPQDRIYHWVPDGDQQVIEIRGVINGTIRFVMSSTGMVYGSGESEDGTVQQFSLLPDTPLAVRHENRNDETITKCYITLLGG